MGRMTTKSQKSPHFTCVQVVCFISLEICWWKLKFYFRLHFNWRFAQKVMGLQNYGSPNLRNFRTPNLRVLGQNDVWVLAPWQNIKNIIKGKVVISSSSSSNESYEFMFTHVSFVHQKCSNYAQINLLFGLCRSV
jgi:hypothetical protein